MSSETDSSPRARAAHSRRPRKTRQLVVPADTLLTFARYHPRTDVERAPRAAKKQTIPRRREHFVQANYRFALDPLYEAGYDVIAAVPDAEIPWTAVDLVFMHHSDDCPICLHPLRCPRVTPCGHVFDFVCMLQHLSHSDDVQGLAKCPICSSRISAEDLRACVLSDVAPIEAGLSCTMRLVSRERGHMIAHPHPTTCHRHMPKVVSSDAPLFSRLSQPDEDYLLRLTAECRKDLHQTLQEEPILRTFIQDAMEILNNNEEKYRMRRAVGHRHRSESDDHCQSLHLATSHGSSSTRRDPWYFYQDKHSRNVFLHPVSHRCIATETRGDFSKVDNEISGEVLQIERYTMTEQLRKRYRFLEHLPLGCEFCFIELDLSHIISEATQAAHFDELMERNLARRRKQMATAREDKLLEKERSERMHEYITAHAGYGSRSIPAEPVDSSDAFNFPALSGSPRSNEIEEVGREDANTDEPKTSTTASTTSTWGAEVSSYSSVTSNMGLFPSLRQTTNSSSSTTSSPEVIATISEDTNSRGEGMSSPRQAPRQLLSPPLETRKGRKSHGRTRILMSNQGSPFRR